MENKLTKETPSHQKIKELEKIGSELSAWVESDEYLEIAQHMEFQERNPKSIARAEGIVAAATRGRPRLAQEISGEAPKINARITPEIRERLNTYSESTGQKPSEIIRLALDQFLPQLQNS